MFPTETPPISARTLPGHIFQMHDFVECVCVCVCLLLTGLPAVQICLWSKWHMITKIKKTVGQLNPKSQLSKKSDAC